MFEALRSERSLEESGMLPGPWELSWEAEHLEGSSPQRILEWAVETYGGGLALSASFGGPEGMALIDMISRLTDEVTILTKTGSVNDTHESVRSCGLPATFRGSAAESLRRGTGRKYCERIGRSRRNVSQVRNIEPLERALRRLRAVTGLRGSNTQRSNTKIALGGRTSREDSAARELSNERLGVRYKNAFP